ESLFQLATQVATAPLRVAVSAAEIGGRMERDARRALTSNAERALIAGLDAVVTRMLEEDVIDHVLERAETVGVAQRIADRILDDGIAEQIADRAFSGPELERILASAFRSALPEELIAQLLASEAVWMLVDEIARSPSVTEAIAHQGTGFFEQVAAGARDRSRRADARVQRIAKRLRPLGPRSGEDGKPHLGGPASGGGPA
ncbi:MAG TPA: hypothetical protein VGH93_03475, partial [Solirubrobacteraceae bacterium]